MQRRGRWTERFNPWVGVAGGLVVAMTLGLVGSMVFHAWAERSSSTTWVLHALPLALGGLLLSALLFAYFRETTARLRRALEEASAARAALAASEGLFRTFAENTTAALFIVKGERILRVNPAMTTLTGYDEPELLARGWAEVMHPDERAALRQRALDRQPGVAPPSRYETRVVRKDGATRWVEVSVSLMEFEGEQATLGTAYDITERREMIDRLRVSEQRHRLLADNASDVIWTMDLGGRFTYISPSVEKLRGYTVAEVMQQTMAEVLTPDSLATFTLSFAQAVEAMSRGEPFPTMRAEVEQPCKDGSTVWTEVTASGIIDEAGEFVGILGVSRDITERRRAALRLQHMAQYDLLTDLPNRALLMDRLGLALSAARRGSHAVAVMFLDLDRFKPVNDAYGHAAGDELLRAVAGRLRSLLRAEDTVARVGGDEFVVLLPRAQSVAEVVHVAEKVRASLAEPYIVAGHRVRISATIGLALFPEHAAEPNALTRCADAAMYAAKSAGRDRVVVWTPALATPEPSWDTPATGNAPLEGA